jgi:chemotaxis protein MotB
MTRHGIVALVIALAACRSKPPQAPTPDPRVDELETQLADTQSKLERQTSELEQLRQSDAELKAKAEEAAALEAKLAEAVGKSGEVTTADGAVRVELVDQILFPVGEAALTPRGKEVLAKVGAALKDIHDKQIWVQGHTDDQPIVRKKPEPTNKQARAARAPKGKKPEPPPPPPSKEDKGAESMQDAMFPVVTNWELSAARALTVVHYLQEDAKIEPTRLAAVAFGEFRPISRNRAKNRRIEIVLYPRAKISPR